MIIFIVIFLFDRTWIECKACGKEGREAYLLQVREAHTAWHIDTHSWSANNFICFFSRLLHSLQFKYLDKDEFKDLKHIRRIHLDGNQLSVVVDGLFSRQKSLGFLGKTSIKSNLILNFKSKYLIMFLDLSRNRLAKISGRAFVNLSNLTHLDISYNKLSTLDSMNHLPKLETLNISGNIQLRLLDLQGVFENLTRLQSLSIADITKLPVGLFVTLPNLQMLNISGTHLGNETNQILRPFKLLKVNIDFIRFNGSLKGTADLIIPKRMAQQDLSNHNFLNFICHKHLWILMFSTRPEFCSP